MSFADLRQEWPAYGQTRPRRSAFRPVLLTLSASLLIILGCGRDTRPGEVRRLASGPGAISHVVCSPDGRALAYHAQHEGGISLWTVPADGGDPKPLASGTGRQPEWSPDGREIAVTRSQAGNWDIYLIRPDGGEPSRLTRDPNADWAPRWSPDGKRIAFMSNREDSVAIWVTPVGEDRAVRVSQAGGVNPSWSPDGKRIAFQAKTGPDSWDLFVTDLETGRVSRLTSGGGADLDPAWSPDGKHLAFRVISNEGVDLYVMPAEGGPARRLTFDAGADGPPVWSPDGARIAFVSYAAFNSLAVAPADGGPVKTVLAGLTQLASLRWHPDGRRILFCARSSDLWTVADGDGAPSRLTHDLYEDRKPDVSPDGKRIVFESNRDGSPGLWTLDGGPPRLLLPHQGADAHPRFSPDGKRIAFTSNREEKGREIDLWTASSDGSDPVRKTTLGGLKGRPTWFVDNARIIFESDMNGGWGLWALEPTGAVKPLPILKPAMRPAWSSDGWWLAYQSQRGGNWDIYLTGMKSGAERRLTTDPAYDSDPAWSRDGRRLAFSSNRSGSDDLYVIPASGEGPERQITSGPDDDEEPAWYPDGKRIVFARIERQSIWSVTVP